MVRLKGAGGSLLNSLFSRFQFHMVRLKVAQRHAINRLSLFQFHMVRLKGIFRPRLQAALQMFQFHMVRLKGYLSYFYLQPKFVSIPHGTIKRKRTYSITTS